MILYLTKRQRDSHRGIQVEYSLRGDTPSIEVVYLGGMPFLTFEDANLKIHYVAVDTIQEVQIAE